jgi:hypothetical protein
MAFNPELKEMGNFLQIREEEKLFKTVSMTLQALKDSGYDLANLSNFNFDKINQQTSSKEENMLKKNKIEKYMKIKIKEILASNKHMNNSKDNLKIKEINQIWSELKSTSTNFNTYEH